MPGPGPHTAYTLAAGVGLLHLTGGRFSPHHCVVYALNAFLGPDLGSFSEWLSSSLGVGRGLASAVMSLIHHPFYYALLLGIPLAFFYRWLSKLCLDKGLLDSVVGVPLSLKQALLLVSAGSLSHFFLDHLFEFLQVKHRNPNLSNEEAVKIAYTLDIYSGPFTQVTTPTYEVPPSPLQMSQQDINEVLTVIALSPSTDISKSILGGYGQSEIRKQDFQCSICGQFGHINICSSQSPSKDSKTCFCCGMSGHTAKECDNKPTSPTPVETPVQNASSA